MRLFFLIVQVFMSVDAFQLSVVSVYQRCVYLMRDTRYLLKDEYNLGPVVQSSVSLTSSLRGQLVKCFTTL